MTAPHRESQPDTRDADMHPEPTELYRQAASMFFCWPTNAIDLAKKDSDLPELIEKLAQFIAAWERKGRRECGVQTEYEFPYQRTFDAIAAAVSFYPCKEEPLGFNVSVRKFQEAFNGHRDKHPLSSSVSSAHSLCEAAYKRAWDAFVESSMDPNEKTFDCIKRCVDAAIESSGGGMERIPVETLAKHFNTSVADAKAAQDNIGFMYRELASPVTSTNGK